ncbi:uncharacterized protein LOC144919004 [Branchiostoma floridae x Branchiostoma belcheri]
MSTMAPVTNVTSAVAVPWIQTVPAVFTILGCIFLAATILICLNLTFCKAWWERSCRCCGRTGFEKVVDEDEIEGRLWLPADDVTGTQNKRSTDIYKVPLVEEAWQDGGQSSRLDDGDGHTEGELRGLVMSAGVKGSRFSLRSGLRPDDVSPPGSRPDVRANSTELIDLEEEDTLGPIRPDTAGSLRPGTAGTLRPDTADSLRPDTAGSLRPGTAGSRRPDTAGSLIPGTAGSLRPGTAGSLRPGTASSLLSDPGRSSARLRRPVSAGSEGRPETAEERWGRKPEGLIEEEERQKLLATLPLRQREELQHVTSLVEVRAQVERWKNKNRMKRRHHRVEPGLETVSTSSDTLSSGSGEDHLHNVRDQWVGSRHLLSSTTLETTDSETPTPGSTSTSVRSARSIDIEPRQNGGHQSSSFASKSPPKTSTSNRLEIISEDDSLESRLGRVTDPHVGPTRTHGRVSALSMSAWREYRQWSAAVSAGRPGAGASRLTDDTALPRSGGSRSSSTTPTVYRYSFRGSDLLTRQTAKGRTAVPFPEPSLTDLPDLLPGSTGVSTTSAAKDTFGWVHNVPIPTDRVSPPVTGGRYGLDDREGAARHGRRAQPSDRSAQNYTPSFDFRHSEQS